MADSIDGPAFRPAIPRAIAEPPATILVPYTPIMLPTEPLTSKPSGGQRADARRLAKALKACRGAKSKHKRRSCEKAARSKTGTAKKQAK